MYGMNKGEEREREPGSNNNNISTSGDEIDVGQQGWPSVPTWRLGS